MQVSARVSTSLASCVKMINFVLKTRSFALETRNRLLNTRNFDFNVDYAGDWPARHVSKNGAFCITSKKLCIKTGKCVSQTRNVSF